MTTEIADGEAVTQAIMRQPLGTGPISCGSFLPFPEHIVECAFETHDDMLCIPRQLAVVLSISLNEAAAYFDELLEPRWRAIGITPLQLKELCRRQGRSFYYLNGHRMLDHYEPPSKKRALKSLALSSWGWACIFIQLCAQRMQKTSGELGL